MDNNYISDDEQIKKSIKTWLISIVAVIFVTITVIFSLIVIYFTYFFIVQPKLDEAEVKKNYINFTHKLGNDYRLVNYGSWGSFGQRVSNVRLEISVIKQKTDKDINHDIIKTLKIAGCRKNDYVYGQSGSSGIGDYSEKKREFFMLSPAKDHMSCAIDAIYANGGVEIHKMYRNIDLSDSTSQYTDGQGATVRQKVVPDETLYSKINIHFVGF